MSEWRLIIKAVSQGSIVGLLLFVCYINELPSVHKFCVAKKKNTETLIEETAANISNLQELFNKNNLKLNKEKKKKN